MEKLARSGRLVEHAQAVAARLGFAVADTATGGASDANTTSGMGVPSLDGLGPIGGNDHAPGGVPRGRLGRAADDDAGRVCCWRSRATPSRGLARRRPALHRRARSVVTEPRRRISSGGPWEVAAGYSRAIVVGDGCWVAGTTDAGPDGSSQHPGDVAAQARAVLAIIERALAEGGFTLADVVRTRMFVVDIADAPAATGRPRRDLRRDPAGRHDGRGRGLMHPSLLIEIEAEARRAG